MSLYDIRDNNYLQPQRFFSIRGKAKIVEREAKWTKVTLEVFSYLAIEGKPDELIVHFRGQTKRIIDNMVKTGQYLLVMGDIIMKAEKVYLDGKIVELYKDMQLISEDNAKIVSPNDTNYENAF